MFQEKANRVRDGFQVNCPNCNRLITLSKETDDPFIRRALKTAREMRTLEQDRIAAAIYCERQGQKALDLHGLEPLRAARPKAGAPSGGWCVNERLR